MPKRPIEDGLSDADKIAIARDPSVGWPFEYDPPSSQACPMCGGRGKVKEIINPERWPETVHCHHCRRWCDQCNKYVKKEGHEHI